MCYINLRTMDVGKAKGNSMQEINIIIDRLIWRHSYPLYPGVNGYFIYSFIFAII